MYPILFKFGFIQIYSYGLMIALAFGVSTALLSRQARELGRPKDFFWYFSVWVLLGGIFGGRLLYIALNFEFFAQNPREIPALWHGGLIWYGALAGGLLSGMGYLRSKKAGVIKTLDLVVPFVALGQAIGRIGCFLNGCCYGRPAKWGIYFPAHKDYLISVQLISSLNLLVIFILLRLLQEIKPKPGKVLAAYLIIASFERFMVEFIRNDSPRDFWGLTVFQLISAAIFIGGILLWCVISWFYPKKPASA